MDSTGWLTLFLVIVTGLLAFVTWMLVRATNESKESAEKQAQASIETYAMNIYFNSEQAFIRAIQEIIKDGKNKTVISEEDKAFVQFPYICQLKILEYLCVKYLNKEISQKTFEDYFKDKIIATFENSYWKLKNKEIPEKDIVFWEWNFESDQTSFPYLRKIYALFKRTPDELTE